jgi:NitT/TauT family transport system substrate-binding protein/sulfonate transport system substrate-binding protein
MKKIAAILATLALAIGAAAAQPLPIAIGAATSVDHAAIFVGVEKGIFARHDLDAKVNMYETGVEEINGLLNGVQQVNVMGGVPFFAGASAGQPLMLIGHLHGDATRDNYDDNVSIVASAASGLKEGDIKGLRGKRIALPRGAGSEYYLLGMLAQNGMKASDVTLVNTSPSNLATALRQNDVDAVAIWEPWASIAAMRVPGAQRIVAGAPCQACYDPGTVLTTKSIIAQQAETLRRFMAAFAEAEQWVRQNLDEAAAIDMHWIPGVDLDVMKVAIRHSHYDPRISAYTVAMYNAKTIPLLLGDKKMTKKIDAATVVDPQFILDAERTSPQYFSDLPPIPEAERLK